MARPKLQIDEALVREAAKLHCTMEEIAALCKCSVDTLERRFADTIKGERAGGKLSLRRWQWREAEKGVPALLIWLGKQELEQREPRQDIGLSDPSGGPVQFIMLPAKGSNGNGNGKPAKADRLKK